jgi:transcriptional regulator with XRE-family HTH domain
MHLMPTSNDDIKARLARLQLLIAEVDLSQRDVANAIGISQGHLSKILSGRTALKTNTLLKLERFMEWRIGMGTDAASLSHSVVDAMQQSDDFRSLVTAALRLMHLMHK